MDAYKILSAFSNLQSSMSKEDCFDLVKLMGVFDEKTLKPL